MYRQNQFTIKKAAKLSIYSLLIAICFGANVWADSHDLFIEGGKFSIDSGGTIERFLSGMTQNQGRIRLKAGFHVDSGVGEFEKLRIEIKKGSETVFNGSCYSIHAPADRTPKCDFTINISATIANIRENYVIKVNNNSGKRIKDFAIRKLGFDPLLPDFQSTFTPDCPNSVNLDMEGATFSLEKGDSETRDLTGVVRKEGKISIKAKWHTATLIPNVFVKLKIELLRPDGTVAKSGSFFSAHAPGDKTPSLRLAMTYDMTQSDAGMTGKWKIKVTNNSNDKIEGFNIEKGGDSNPFVSAFNSTYKEDCQ